MFPLIPIAMAAMSAMSQKKDQGSAPVQPSSGQGQIQGNPQVQNIFDPMKYLPPQLSGLASMIPQAGQTGTDPNQPQKKNLFQSLSDAFGNKGE